MGQLPCYDRQEICKSANSSWVIPNGYLGQHGVAARAAAGQLWTLRPRRLRSCRSMQQLQSRRTPSAALSLKHPDSSWTNFFYQGFGFAQKFASFAQNLCFPLLPCLQMFCPFCINLKLEGFAGNWKEARSFYLWLSSSTCKRGRRRLAVASRRATRPPPPPPPPPPPCRLR